MGIWFKTLLLFVVFNEVQLYRQLKNFTCLELAKPSNQQFRLPCNNTSTYHCLLNGNSTNEFEICKTWKWIPEGNCAYLNTYGWNIDARSCSSSAELACPKMLYQSEDTIKYAACYVKKNTNPTARQVRNTTCLELAKPSNLQFRMSCKNTGTYHCLLDQNYTKEYEICKMWKWISKGKCAYFSMYSGGIIDERNCTSSSHFVCPEKQYQSENTTNYSACYIRNNPATIRPLTSPLPAASDRTSSDGNGGNATSSRISETAEKHIEMKSLALPTILGIIVPLVSVAVIYFTFRHLKYVPLYKKASQESSDREANEDVEEQQGFLRNKPGDTSESPPTMRHEDENITEVGRNAYPVASQESSDREGNDDTVEKQPVLRIKVEDTSESPPTMGHEDENITEAKKNGNSGAHDPADSNESDLSEHLEDAASPLTSIIQNNSNVIADDGREEEKEEKSTDSIPGSCGVSKNSYDEKEDDEESRDVFYDTTESFQRIAPPTDEQGREMCTELYNLLENEGVKLTKKVMTATITRITGKSVKTLLNNLIVQDKSKLKEALPEELYRILESKEEGDMSFRVLYDLHRIFLDDEQSPKSGWGNPIRKKDIGIGDDVERLYSIQTIVREIPDPVTVSVESYIRLLDIMSKALTRLDSDAEFKEDLKILAKEITCMKQ